MRNSKCVINTDLLLVQILENRKIRDEGSKRVRNPKYLINTGPVMLINLWLFIMILQNFMG